MQILVTGGAGFIGSHLSRRLISKGHQVTVLDNLSTGVRENVPAEADFIELDLTKPDVLADLPDKPFGAICHLAGQSSGEKSFEDPLYDLQANAQSTLQLATWAISKSIPAFLYASSMGVYGQVERQPVSESTAPQPISYYGVSKRSAELLLEVAAQQNLLVVAFRMFNVYGPGQNLSNMKQGMVSIYLAYLLKRQPLIVKGSLERIRDLIYVDDVVEAWELALDRQVQGIFNLGSGTGTSVRSLISQLLSACGLSHDYPIEQVDNTRGDQFAMTADIDLLSRALDWQPKISLTEGLDKMVAWARAQQGGAR